MTEKYIFGLSISLNCFKVFLCKYPK